MRRPGFVMAVMVSLFALGGVLSCERSPNSQTPGAKPAPLGTPDRVRLEAAVRESAARLRAISDAAPAGSEAGLDAARALEGVLSKVRDSLSPGDAPEADREALTRQFKVWNYHWPLVTGRLDEHDLDAVRALLARYRNAGFFEAVDRLRGFRRMRWWEGELDDVTKFSDRALSMTLTMACRSASKALVSELRLAAHDRDWVSAARDLGRTLDLADVCESRPFAINCLVADSIRTLVLREVLALVTERTIDSRGRLALSEVLGQDRPGLDLHEAAVAEHWFSRGATAAEIITRCDPAWTDPLGELGGEGVAAGLMTAVHSSESAARTRFAAPDAGLGDPTAGLPRLEVLPESLRRDAAPGFSPLAVRGRAQAGMYFRAARVALALGAFHEARGAYPASLGELGPGFISPVPIDPFADRPFGYRRLGRDPYGRGYLLYSLWMDQMDQGGAMGQDGRVTGFPDKDAGFDLVLNQPREPKAGEGP